LIGQFDDFKHFIATRVNMQDNTQLNYLYSLTSYKEFDQISGVKSVIDQFRGFINEIKCSYMVEEECLQLCQIYYVILDWIVLGLEECGKTHILVNNIASLNTVLGYLFDEINWLLNDQFPSLLIYVFFEVFDNDEKFMGAKSKLLARLQASLVTFKEICSDKEKHNVLTNSEVEKDEEINKKQLSGYIEKWEKIIVVFQNSPRLASSEWRPFREDYIYRRYRPAILTLGSIFAAFRVLKSVEDIADTFLTMGDILGLSRTNLISDILRAGFLVQLETADQHHDRDRETLADMFVYLKIPRVLSNLIERGVHRSDILTALHQTSSCKTILKELDVKKEDDTFKFFLEELRRSKVLDEDNYRTLLAERLDFYISIDKN